MKVTIEFDLSKDEDRKHYNAWIKMKELTINLEKFREQINNFDFICSNQTADSFKFFDEMIWRKLG